MKRVHVAVAVIINSDGHILIAKRPEHVHQGGLWEFPGGKVEAGESLELALKRELQEELGIELQACEPLLEIHHDYPDKQVFLEVCSVTAFSGEAYGREQQPIRWVSAASLSEYDFPVANQPIIEAILSMSSRLYSLG
jgi:8-oxo-dGTP diphosphatase